MSDQLSTDPQILEKKDKAQLAAIVTALGGKASGRSTKADLIEEIQRLSAEELEDEVAEDDEEEVQETDAADPDPNNAADPEPQDQANQRNPKGRRGKKMPRSEAGNDPVSNDLEQVSGFLDLRDEGYGFLRVNGFLPSKDDVYVSVKQVRQLELRRGDHLTGKATPAHRNEKNPSFSNIETVNGSRPEDAAKRANFDELTPVSPNQQIRLETDAEDASIVNRVIDLVAPIGKGQRAIVSGPAKSGRTTLVADMAVAVETNYSEMSVLILAIGSRPEEVTYLRSRLNEGEVIASAFDRSVEEHIATAELTLERAKRMAEKGEDVFIVVDSLTDLSKAYIANYIATSRSSAANVELPALEPVRRILGAAAKLDEAGSVTVVSVMKDSVFDTDYPDSMIYSELSAHANCEIVLDSAAGVATADPVVDVSASATSWVEFMMDTEDVEAMAAIRDLVADADVAMADADASSGYDQLLELIESKDTNADVLAHIAKKNSLS